jgi:hypothetical protein
LLLLHGKSRKISFDFFHYKLASLYATLFSLKSERMAA